MIIMFHDLIGKSIQTNSGIQTIKSLVRYKWNYSIRLFKIYKLLVPLQAFILRTNVFIMKWTKVFQTYQISGNFLLKIKNFLTRIRFPGFIAYNLFLQKLLCIVIDLSNKFLWSISSSHQIVL